MKLWMRAWTCLACLILLLQTPCASAQVAQMPAATTNQASTSASQSVAAFELSIEAPDEITALLQRHLELQRYRALDDLSDAELDRLLTLAHEDVQKLVATAGYFSPVIAIERMPGTDGRGTRRIRIGVAPGEPVRVSAVRIDFAGDIGSASDAAAQRQRISDSWLLPAGKRFTQSQWDAAKQQALRQLTSERYPLGRISQSLADVDPPTRSAHLQLTLESGPALRFGALDINGLQRYDAELVQRLARVPTGADYDLRELVAAQQRLSNSGYFDSAFVRIDPDSPPQAAKVLVTVREAPLQKITLGVGASTDSGPRLSAEHLHHRVPGLDWQALSTLSLDRETQRLGTELTSKPDVDGWRWNTGLQLQNQQSGSFEIFSQRWRVGKSQATQHIDRNYFLQFDRADTATSDTAVATVAQSISANLAFTSRHFDSLPLPTNGWAWGVELGAGTTLEQPQVPYGRVLTRWHYLWSPGTPPGGTSRPDVRAGRLALRSQVGAVFAKDGVSVPATQLFLAGGDNSVRGYALRSIGIRLADGRVSAGRYLVVGSAEWQQPITSAKGVLTDWEGALFVDAGAVADTPRELNAQVGVGGGVRWKTPVGPLQIDLAYGVEVQRWRLHLNIGFVF